jgi:aminomethyltransferase
VTVSRTGYTGDLGYEIWVGRGDAEQVWDAIYETATSLGGMACGQLAMLLARIEAGLILIDVDFDSARFSWNDDQRVTATELGMGWMIRGIDRDDRAFIGRSAIEREIAGQGPRWDTVGIMVDWKDWNRVYDRRGLIPPKSHLPESGKMLYDSSLGNIGYVTSFAYSPVLQRHIGIARIRPDHGAIGTQVSVEVTIDHRYDTVMAEVAKLPFYNPRRKTA